MYDDDACVDINTVRDEVSEIIMHDDNDDNNDDKKSHTHKNDVNLQRETSVMQVYMSDDDDV